VAQPFQGVRHPFALRRRLEQDPRPRPRPKQLRQPLATRADPPLDEHPPALVDDADLAFPLMDVDPMYSMAGLPPLVGGAEVYHWAGSQPLHPIYLRTTFRANAVRLQLHALAYNLANFLRTLALPGEVERWSLTSLREKVVKIGAKVIAHGRYAVFQMAEVAVARDLFGRILDRIARLRPPDLAPC
jgi:hypothetical protein